MPRASPRARSSDVALRDDASTDARAGANVGERATSSASFGALQLDERLTRALRAAGFDAPSPVQLACVPLGRFGCDVIAQAKSGTGKTMTFVVIALERVDAGRRRTQALALAPTRECAVQTHECFVEMIEKFKDMDGDARGGIETCLLVGGLPVKEDRARLASQPHVVVGTPGRTRQMLEEGSMACDGARLLILDEADALLSGTFERDVLFAYSMLPERKQVCAFSATYSKTLLGDLERLMRAPQKVMLCESTTALQGVRQFYSLIEKEDGTKLADVITAKEARLLKICGDVSFHQAVVFVRRLAWGEALAKRLTSQGLKAAFTAGTLPQERRMKVMEEMRNFQLRVLVSTDLTARGVDLTHVNLVINLDVPPSGATYMHRIGRTGRFGTYGLAVAVLTADELEQLRAGLVNERGGNIEPLPDTIPSNWYDYELDDTDAELFQTLKDAPIESSDESDDEFVADEPQSSEPDCRARVRDSHRHAYTLHVVDESDYDDTSETDMDVVDDAYHRGTTTTARDDARSRRSYDDYWRWFRLRHPPAARPPRYLPLPPGASAQPWIVPPLHADLRRLPYVRHRP